MKQLDDLDYIYNQLKDKYNLVLTSTKKLDEGFTIDTKVITGSSKSGTFQLYYDGMYVFCIEYSNKTYTHFHPNDLEDAIESIEEFME